MSNLKTSNSLPNPQSRATFQAERRRAMAKLLPVYGSLLSERQQSIMSRYCLQKKSFSQIAREEGVSRQAIHEGLTATAQLLQWYEERLGLLSTARGRDPIRSQVQAWILEVETVIRTQGLPPSAAWIVQNLERLRSLAAVANTAHKRGAKQAGRSRKD